MNVSTGKRCLLLILMLGSCSNAQTEPASPLQVLLITGGGWHDFNTQQPLLIDGLNSRISNINWTVVHEGDKRPDHLTSVLQQDDWAEQYDLVIHNT
ncbi:MAG TPA: hypothetical protein VIC08_12890, partial [Cellvibrionaceae bacterium]